MAGNPWEKKPHGIPKNCGRKLPKAEREKRKKTERKVLPKLIPNPIPVRSCAENRTGPKSPTTRAPTRTPSGETGPEDSWLRLLSGSDQS